MTTSASVRPYRTAAPVSRSKNSAEFAPEARRDDDVNDRLQTEPAVFGQFADVVDPRRQHRPRVLGHLDGDLRRQDGDERQADGQIERNETLDAGRFDDVSLAPFPVGGATAMPAGDDADEHRDRTTDDDQIGKNVGNDIVEGRPDPLLSYTMLLMYPNVRKEINYKMLYSRYSRNFVDNYPSKCDTVLCLQH